MDDAVRAVLGLSKKTEMAKLGIENTYRIVPVHPDDHLLLGMSWKGRVYGDMALPFGLRSAPKLFNAVADALQWIFLENGVICLHVSIINSGKSKNERVMHLMRCLFSSWLAPMSS